MTAYNFKSLLFVLILIQFSVESFAQENVELVDVEVVKTVVIDAGHGGKDPGCLGSELREKEITLNIAKKLARYIKEVYPKVNVILTRDEDVFLELDQRARIANDNQADLFISIHANAASPAAYGVETFVLGLHRTESQQKVAERENSIIHFEENSEEKYKDFDLSPDAIIARQIQLSVFLSQSIAFADMIQQSFKAIGRRDRGVKQAGFFVLYKTTMPSVLIESGFLTNHNEHDYLKDTLNQSNMAHAIFSAFQRYKSELEGVNWEIVEAPSFLEEKKKVALHNQNNVEMKDELEEQTVEEDKEDQSEKIMLRVQIVTSRTKLPIYDDRFKGLKVYEYYESGLYKYTSGEFVNDLDAVREHKAMLKEKGFEHAFIVAFKNNERIPALDAVKQLSE